MWPEGFARSLWRISALRLALLSILASLVGALLVFGIVHHAAESGWRDQMDERVRDAQADILGDIQNNHESLSWNVRATLAEGSGLFYAALAPDGRWIAGNFRLSAMAADGWAGPKTLKSEPGLTLPQHVLAIRGTVLRFPDGERLFIAADASALVTLKSLIVSSFLGVFGILLALGLVTGLWAARGTLKRVDRFANALHKIMEGDLSRRIAVDGSGNEFDRLATEMNQMLQRIQELMESLRQVTNDISHDLRSPLARLREHIELSRARFSDPALAEVCDEAITQLDQALGIFTAMLRIAEVEAGARRTRFAPVDLSALLAILVESYEPVLAESGITLTADIADGLRVQGDHELLAQLLVNLLDNVAIHAHGATKAEIHAVEKNGWAMLRISDDGCGIPAEARELVLQRFVRLDAARHSPVHGLVLALANAIITLHGARFALTGGEGTGLILRIELKAID